MHFYSYDMKDPVFEAFGWQFSVQIVGRTNLYGLAPEHCGMGEETDARTLTCGGLSAAGGQLSVAGGLRLKARRARTGELRISMEASAGEDIRCVKLILRNLPKLTLYDYNLKPIRASDNGILLSYPLFARLPMITVAAGDTVYGFLSADEKVHAKRFAAFPEEELWGAPGRMAVELIHEEDARLFRRSIEVPDWILQASDRLDGPLHSFLAMLEERGALTPWELREDMPAWLKEVSLCVTLHGMHWSGHLFNTYDGMLDILRYVSGRIEGRRVLAFLPGWEGRYYWQYGDMRPDGRMGGEQGFLRLCRGAAEMGMHVMPMFGGNCVNRRLRGMEALSRKAVLRTPFGNPHLGNGPDWNQDRSHDTGWQAWLNPGNPLWRKELTRQILRLRKRHGFDAAYLDTVYCWVNDPRHNVFDGIRGLRDALAEGSGDFLVAAEDWWDALLGVFPLFLDDWDPTAVPLPEWFGRYARCISFIGREEPGRGSGGVQHGRHFPYERPALDIARIPTVSFVDGTLETARGEVDRAIARGEEYARLYL